MIRGVNKNIIEISDTGNECFERAILFVRPDSLRSDPLPEAQEFLRGLKLRKRFYVREKLWLTAVKLAAAAFAGAAIAAILLVR